MKYVLTLIYEDDSTFLVGTFNSMDELNAWLDEEQTRPYWNINTQTQIDEVE